MRTPAADIAPQSIAVLGYEIGEADRQRLRALARSQCQGDQEVVPGEEKGDDGAGADARRNERVTIWTRIRSVPGAVHRGGFLDLLRHVLDESDQQPYRDGKFRGRMSEDQRRQSVQHAEFREHREERNRERDDGDHPHDEEQRHDELLAGKPEARDRVGAWHREQGHGDHRRKRDDDRVPEIVGETVLAEDRDILADTSPTRDDVHGRRENIGRNAQRRDDEPDERKDREHDRPDEHRVARGKPNRKGRRRVGRTAATTRRLQRSGRSSPSSRLPRATVRRRGRPRSRSEMKSAM